MNRVIKEENSPYSQSEVSVPFPDDAALPKASLCSRNKELDERKLTKDISNSRKRSKENLPNNCPISCNKVEESSAALAKKADKKKTSNNSTKKRSRKKESEVKSHLLTEYFPVRRSNRKTTYTRLKEKQKLVEDAVLSGKEDGFEVRNFPGKGRGVVTTKCIKRGDFVLEYHGERIGMEEAKARELRYSAKKNTGCYMYYFKHDNKQYCIDATKESVRLGRLVNHSKKGNLKTQSFVINDVPHLILVACRDIAPGEELLYDYGDRSKISLDFYPWLAS